MRSLRVQLVLIATVVLLLGLAVTVGFALVGARSRVQAEVSSSLRLGRILLRAELINIANAPDPAQAFAGLGEDLPRIRHLRFVVVSADMRTLANQTARSGTEAPPAWFTALFDPASTIETIAAQANGQPLGEIEMISRPQDEIGEIWSELRYLTLLLSCLAVATALLIYLATSVALRPLEALQAGFDRLERGDFSVSVAPIRVIELRRIGEQLDRLARSLRRVTADNHLLIDRLISLQEAERKEVAHELHDEFGPSLFGIRADVACILAAAKPDAADLGEVRARAISVGQLADGIQRINIRMLDRLRPMVLDQMGLGEGLRQLVDDWRDRYPSLSITLHLDNAVETVAEPTGLTLYRVVQECLTNVARHAGATLVRLDLRCEPAAGYGTEEIHVSVRDDGCGFPDEPRFGFGLLGMSERARALGGRLRVSAAPAGGALVEVWLPLAAIRADVSAAPDPR